VSNRDMVGPGTSPGLSTSPFTEYGNASLLSCAISHRGEVMRGFLYFWHLGPGGVNARQFLLEQGGQASWEVVKAKQLNPPIVKGATGVPLLVKGLADSPFTQGSRKSSFGKGVFPGEKVPCSNSSEEGAGVRLW
jgi:hypothetical protein